MVFRNLLIPAVAALLLSVPPRTAAQTAAVGTDSAFVVADSGDVHGQARAAQANFERRRTRYFPFRLASSGGRCDETVGRLCVTYGEGEWYPTPEPEEARELRRELLAELDSLQRLIPGDGWVLGQRVWYRAEAGDWDGALATVRDCGPVRRWWCMALQGLALHGLERYGEALRRFERALSLMDPETAREWRLAEWPVDGDTRELIRDAEKAHPDSLSRTLQRLWGLADPLYLVAGNDRQTAHYARWTVATLKDGARNPYRLRWGRDLTELTVRHGWERGWERSFGSYPGAPNTITGHQANESRDYMPAGEVLARPTAATFEELVAGVHRPRSLYQPPYAPVLLPMEGQLAVFPRTDATVVAATHFLPADTTFHAEHHHERPWLEPGDQVGMQDRIGLFAFPAGGGRTLGQRRLGRSEGALLLEVPPGSYVVSAESWSPERRRAGRLRAGLEAVAAPEDVATLSDILLLAAGGTTPGSLIEALPAALPRAQIGAGRDIAIAWEVSGLGFRAEVFQFEVSVDKTDRNVFRRIGEFFGLSERPPSLALSWEEPGPDRPAHHFRHLDLDLPDLDPGDYRVTLTLRTSGRSDAVTTRSFEVVDE